MFSPVDHRAGKRARTTPPGDGPAKKWNPQLRGRRCGGRVFLQGLDGGDDGMEILKVGRAVVGDGVGREGGIVG
jgi:hypothetical protein